MGASRSAPRPELRPGRLHRADGSQAVGMDDVGETMPYNLFARHAQCSRALRGGKYEIPNAEDEDGI